MKTSVRKAVDPILVRRLGTHFDFTLKLQEQVISRNKTPEVDCERNFT